MTNDLIILLLIVYFLGIINTLAIYHFFVFLNRRNDKSNIGYLLLNVAMAFILIIRRLYNYFPNYNKDVYYICIPLALAFFAIALNYFPHTIFKLHKFKILSIIISILFALVGILSATIYIVKKDPLFSDSLTPALSMLYSIYIIAMCIYVILFQKKKSVFENIILYIYIIYLINLLVTGLLWGVFHIRIPTAIVYFPYIVVALIFALILMSKFGQDHYDLKILKKNLEQKVKDRTKELERANREIKESSQRQADFFVNLAHETRTPLQLILSYLDDYIDEVGESEELNIIERNFDKLLNDMVNFLDMTKLERGQVFYDHTQIINLADVLRMKIDLFKNVAEKKNIKIEISIEQNEFYTKIDSFAIDRVINNLLDNAIKYTNKDGCIEVALKSEENKIRMTVEDNGIGISKDQQKHIFEAYHQMSHVKHQHQGLGMGLTIVKQIMDEVDGSIDLRSSFDKGTLFTILFNKHNLNSLEKEEPISALTKPSSNIKTRELAEFPFDNKKPSIFIVEDEVDLVAYLQSKLKDKYNIFYASNGKEALDKLNNISKPDIILADIMMPIMDGYEMREILAKDKSFNAIPFIFLTAKTRADDKLAGLKKGAVDFITKPIVIEELRAKLESIIKTGEAHKANIIEKWDNEYKEKLKIFYKEKNITPQEKKIIELVLKGKENKEIASDLNIKEKTVKNHLHSIFIKTEVGTRLELLNILKKTNLS